MTTRTARCAPPPGGRWPGRASPARPDPEITRSFQSMSTPKSSTMRVSRSGAALLRSPMRVPLARSARASAMFGSCSSIGREYHSSKMASARSPQCSASEAMAASRQIVRLPCPRLELPPGIGAVERSRQRAARQTVPVAKDLVRVPVLAQQHPAEVEQHRPFAGTWPLPPSSRAVAGRSSGPRALAGRPRACAGTCRPPSTAPCPGSAGSSRAC